MLTLPVGKFYVATVLFQKLCNYNYSHFSQHDATIG